MTRTAVVLFNLGGPDSPETIQPFLNNLFNDPAIIGLPWPLRPILASAISNKRQKEAREIYARIGGRSPLLEGTRAQAKTLQGRLDNDTRVFIAMRYWHPMSEDTALEVAAFKPDRIVLLPLYPQFSTTTTGSSIKAWNKAASKVGLNVPTTAVCCYPTQVGVVAAHVGLLQAALDEAGERPVRVLFSAHGLPEKIVKSGDPYQWQIEQTAAAIVAGLDRPDLDWQVCYQSRVGPLAWIGPSTDDEIKRAGAEAKGVIVIPVAFVSEHSETLVELDIEYAEMAAKHGASPYLRVPALGVTEAFIDGLATVVTDALAEGRASPSGDAGRRVCPASWGRCPCREA